MKKETIYTAMMRKATKAETRIDVMDIASAAAEEAMAADASLWSVDRNIAGYGTWKATLWLNEYRFGGEMAAQQFSLVTHDEDKAFTIEDFRTQIEDWLQEKAYDAWNGDWKEEDDD